MTPELRDLAHEMDLVVSSVWDGYTRKWIVCERDGYYPIFTTNDYDVLIRGMRNGGRFD